MIKRRLCETLEILKGLPIKCHAQPDIPLPRPMMLRIEHDHVAVWFPLVGLKFQNLDG